MPNSNPHKDRDLRERYLTQWYDDEAHDYIARAFPEAFRKLWPKYWARVPASECHHIHGSRKGRWDLWSELISVHRTNHDWLELHPREAKLICLKAKFDKRRPEDFNLEELSKASGYCYPEVISTYDDCGNPVLAKWRDEMVSALSQKGAA